MPLYILFFSVIFLNCCIKERGRKRRTGYREGHRNTPTASDQGGKAPESQFKWATENGKQANVRVRRKDKRVNNVVKRALGPALLLLLPLLLPLSPLSAGSSSLVASTRRESSKPASTARHVWRAFPVCTHNRRQRIKET